MNTLEEIKHTIQTLVAVKEAAKAMLDEPSAIHKATRMQELDRTIQHYEKTMKHYMENL